MTPEERALLAARLAEAEKAYHDLALGKRVSSVNYDGKAVSYSNSANSMADLRSYILELKAKLGLLPRRPLSFQSSV